jgi:hypothetical protein
MPPNDGLATPIAQLIALPFEFLRDIYRCLKWLNGWRLHRAGLPPAILNRSRAVAGTFALAAVTDLALNLRVLTGFGFSAQLANLLRSHVLSPALAALLAVGATALMMLIVGIRGGRGGPRDPIAALMALSIAAGAASLLWWQCYVPADADNRAAALWVNALLHTLYVAMLTASLLRAFLSTPPLFGGNALRRVLRHIEDRIGRLRPARRRSY